MLIFPWSSLAAWWNAPFSLRSSALENGPNFYRHLSSAPRDINHYGAGKNHLYFVCGCKIEQTMVLVKIFQSLTPAAFTCGEMHCEAKEYGGIVQRVTF
ncbi:hypothetical protein ACFQAT_18610 [Undibacterium arcticum]|uniref:hypothetical protein n=1 Tax=Undibacterium arcticum TaxID=1762892 RepID=UPI0036137946